MDLARVALTTARTMVDQHLAALGVEVPKPYRDDLAAIDATLARLDRLAPDRRALAVAVADALDRDDDPATDPTVLAAATREQLHSLNVGHAVAQVADERRAAAIARHAPTILASLAPTIAAADDALRQARARIGRRLDLTDVHYVTQLPPESMAAWGAGRDAVARVERVGQVWTSVVRAAGLAPLDDQWRPLVVADLTATQLAALPARTVVAPAHAGHRLGLASIEDYRARVAAVQAQQARAARPGQQHDDDDEPTNDKRTKRTKAGAAST